MTFSAAAAQADAVATLIGCLTAWPGDASIVTKSLHVLQRLLAVDGSKAAFMRADGASQLANLLSKRSIYGEQVAQSMATHRIRLHKAASAGWHQLACTCI